MAKARWILESDVFFCRYFFVCATKDLQKTHFFYAKVRNGNQRMIGQAVAA